MASSRKRLLTGAGGAAEDAALLQAVELGADAETCRFW
jgi:hypothetical protein